MIMLNSYALLILVYSESEGCFQLSLAVQSFVMSKRECTNLKPSFFQKILSLRDYFGRVMYNMEKIKEALGFQVFFSSA